MADNMIYQDVFKCSNCGYEMDENFIGCPKCKEMGIIKFEKNIAVGPCQCADCVTAAERKEKHLNSPFYKTVKEKVEHFALQQILKGAETYPEPFNPDSWTEEQLYEHTMQELADAQNYSTGMLDRMVKQRQEIERLNKENENQLHYINSARKDYTQSIETIDELRKENAALERLKDDWYEEYQKALQKIADLESENRTLKGEF
jgi:lipopolysaccharide biosynthesis regulator YciM